MNWLGIQIPMQLIITHELTKEKNFWMQSLRNNLKSGGEIRNLIEEYEEKKSKPFYQAVMQVIVEANRKEMEVEKKMCEALKELFADEFREAEKTGERTGIRILIESGYAWKKSMKEITDMLIMKFGLSQSEAEKYVKAYYK